MRLKKNRDILLARKMLFLRLPSLDMGNVAKVRNIQQGTIPYGILSIMTYVRKYLERDVALEILDLNIPPWSGYSLKEMLVNVSKHIESNKPDIVGMSAMYNHIYPYIATFGKAIKEVDKDIIVLAGGSCIMAYYEEILRDVDCVDAIGYSEGEIPILDLLNSADMRLTLETHQSFLTKSGMGRGKKPMATFVQNLDDIPLVDYSFIDLSKYITKYHVFRPNKVENEMCLPITTTRGCPFKCNFCIAGELHGKLVRKMSAQRVVDDVKEMKDKYGMNVLTIEDDQSLMGLERAKQMLGGLSQLDLELWMIGGFTMSLIDDEIIKLLRKAGLQVATLPIESGSEYILHEIIDKPIKLEMIPGTVKSLKENGILVHCNIIIGFPGEKEEHRQESIELVKNSNIDWCYVFCASALKGSRLYNECIEKEYIDVDKHNEDGYCASNINTPDFTAEEITRKAYMMNLELNFVCNNRMRGGDYKVAILYFKHVVSRYPDHAFGHYYLSKCYEAIGDEDRAAQHVEDFIKITSNSDEWRQFARHFMILS